MPTLRFLQFLIKLLNYLNQIKSHLHIQIQTPKTAFENLSLKDRISKIKSLSKNYIFSPAQIANISGNPSLVPPKSEKNSFRTGHPQIKQYCLDVIEKIDDGVGVTDPKLGKICGFCLMPKKLLACSFRDIQERCNLGTKTSRNKKNQEQNKLGTTIQERNKLGTKTSRNEDN